MQMSFKRLYKLDHNMQKISLNFYVKTKLHKIKS